MVWWKRVLTALLVAAASLCGWTRAGESADPTAVLDTYGFWRVWNVLEPPVVAAAGRLVPREGGPEWLTSPTAQPPKGWHEPGFDDATWLRTTARGGCTTPYLSRECLRGKFRVTDPGAVVGLAVSVKYHGGAAVYLNGVEVARGHLPTGEIDAETLAEAYPRDVYVDRAGDLIADAGTYIARGRRAGKPDEDARARMVRRVRTLDAPVPAALLREGVNVLAVEIVRAPYDEVMLEDEEAAGANRRNKYDWNTCEVLGVRLTAESAVGLEPNVTRPEGFQVWNSPLPAGDTDLDFGDPCEPLRPIELVGARNGCHSGKVVVGSTEPITGLAAEATSLRGPGAEIPGDAVAVRYGYPWGTEAGLTRGGGAIPAPYPQSAALFGALTEQAPAEVAVRGGRGPMAPGAVVPVWVTVTVPKDVPAGAYVGELRITADGLTPVSVPVRMEVADWTLPDPQDYRTWVELVEVPDTLSVEYGEPLWSEEHFRMIAEAFRLIRRTGTRVVYVPLIAHTNLGNAESMVRWVETGDGEYTWDFSVMDRYLDLAEENLGRPKIVVLQVWDVYMSTRDSIGKRFGLEYEERRSASEGGPLVTVLDRETGAAENVALPGLTDPWSKPVWTDLLHRVRDRLRQRGLEDTMMVGMFTDAIPPKQHIEFFDGILPGVRWVQQGHGRWTSKVHGIAEVGYQATVWGGFRFADGLRQTNQRGDPIMESLHGWAGESLDAVFERNTSLDTYPATRWYFFPETGVTSELRGVGRIGADYWKAVKDRRGRRAGWVHNRFSEGQWGGSSINLNLCNPTLAPGPDGPLATARLVAMVEGVQAAEARIVIEAALIDDAGKARLGSDLAQRADDLLQARLETMWKTLSNYQLGGPMFFGATAWRWTPGIPGHRWFLGTGWRRDLQRLYETAGEVTRAASEGDAQAR